MENKTMIKGIMRIMCDQVNHNIVLGYERVDSQP